VTKVPNGLLDDYPAARGWITQELGRSAGALRNNWVLNGSGSGQPTGIYTNGSIPISNATGTTGRKIIEAIFGAIQHVRGNGFTQPTDIVLNPAVWTKIFLAWEDNIGYLFGTPGTNDVAPRGEVTSRLFGIPVTQDYYVTTAYGGTASSVSPVVVGNFRDAIVLDRMPFRIDVDTSVGFLKNYSIFRGEFRMGFLVVRPLSFEKVSNIVAT
jgi:HK97 family phage major capsid protein